MPRLSLHERHQALGMLEAGVSQHDVAEHFHCHRNTISALVRRYRERNDAADPRTGCPRMTIHRQDRWIRVTHLRNHHETAADTSQRIPNNRRIYPTMVCRRLREIELRPCRPAVRINMAEHHRQARRGWCRRHVRHPLRWWRNVIYTDESRLQLSRPYTRLLTQGWTLCAMLHAVEHDRYGGGSVVIWGGINKNCFLNSLYPRTIPEWNALPDHLRSAKSVTIFKTQLDNLNISNLSMRVRFKN